MKRHHRKIVSAAAVILAALVLLSGCTRQAPLAADEPEDVIIREEPMVPQQEEWPEYEGPPEGENNDFPTVERFTEAADMKETLEALVEGKFETINTGMGIIDRAGIGTGYVEIKRFENGLLNYVAFHIPYDGESAENALEELAGYAALLVGNQLDEESETALADALAACTGNSASEPTELLYGDASLYLVYDAEAETVTIMR